jgi:hypothetical protein
MITLTREEAQQVLDALKTLHAKLNEYPKNKVQPHEFLKAVEGKENLIGMPIMWAEWPTKEKNNG